MNEMAAIWFNHFRRHAVGTKLKAQTVIYITRFMRVAWKHYIDTNVPSTL